MSATDPRRPDGAGDWAPPGATAAPGAWTPAGPADRPTAAAPGVWMPAVQTEQPTAPAAWTPAGPAEQVPAPAPAAPYGYPAHPFHGAPSAPATAPYAHPTAAPYGYPAGAPYGSSTPAAPPPFGYPTALPYGAPTAPVLPPYLPASPVRPERNSHAIASVVTGAVGVVLAVPTAGMVAVMTGLVGVGLGLAGLARVRRAGGRALAVLGLVLSSLALLGGGALLVALGPTMVESFREGYDSASAPGYSDGATDEDWVDLPGPSLTLGQPATVGFYTVTVTAIDLDGDADVASADPQNAAPAGRYVLAEVTVMYRGTSEGHPYDDLLVSYLGSDDYLYDETSCAATTAHPIADVGTLAPDQGATFTACMDVPASAVTEKSVLVEDLRASELEGAVWEDVAPAP